jgi:hypothetical protein
MGVIMVCELLLDPPPEFEATGVTETELEAVPSPAVFTAFR